MFYKMINEAFEVHNQLNPKLWDNDKLKCEVKEKILQIVEYFKNYIDFPLDIVDINLVGSNASFNYTANSDLDIHIIVSFEFIDQNKELVNALYNCKKADFNKQHNIKIKGIDAEVYVEDINSTTISNGIYSVLQDKWIKYPQNITNIKQVNIDKEIKNMSNKLNDVLQNSTLQDIKMAINQLYLIRKNSLAIDGEYGPGNQLFKELRANGILDGLKNKVKELTSQQLSLESLDQYKTLGELVSTM